MDQSLRIQGYADALIANAFYLLPEGSSKVFFVTVAMRCSEPGDYRAEHATVGGYLHLACHAPTGRIDVYAAFAQRPLEGNQKHIDLPWQKVGSSRQYPAWAEWGLRPTLVRAYADVQERAAEVFGNRTESSQQWHTYVAIDEMGIVSDSEILCFERVRELPVVGALDVCALLKSWAKEAVAAPTA